MKKTLSNEQIDFLAEQVKPKNIIHHIPDFKAWLKIGDPSVKTLEDTLKRFENDEMYEHCQMILDEINFLKNK